MYRQCSQLSVLLVEKVQRLHNRIENLEIEGNRKDRRNVSGGIWSRGRS
jgi:hypothetical protein